MSTCAGNVDFGLSINVLSISEVRSEVALDSFSEAEWYYIDGIVLSSLMLFKRSFGLTRSLFILYVHEHDRVKQL